MTEQIKPNKYHGGKIYTLRSPSTDKIYIGSTTQQLFKRLYEHKHTKYNDISKLDDFYIELLEDFKCENREQLLKREGELIRENKDKCVNKRIEGRTKKELLECNKEYKKNYRDNNQEKIKEYTKEYYENNQEKIKEYRENNQEYQKEYNTNYRKNNKEKIKEKDRLYRENNKEKIKETNRLYRLSKQQNHL